MLKSGKVDSHGLLTRGQIENGDAVYSCNCGWIDKSHSNPRKRTKLWNDIRNGDGKQQSFIADGFKVTYSMYQTKKLAYVGTARSGVEGSWFVANDLTEDQQFAVAFGIELETAYAFEVHQGAGLIGVFSGHSSFSEEDIISDLLGLYAARKGWGRGDFWEKQKKACDDIGKDGSLALYDKIGGVKQRKPDTLAAACSPTDYNGQTSCCKGALQWPSSEFPIPQQIRRGYWNPGATTGSMVH